MVPGENHIGDCIFIVYTCAILQLVMISTLS